MRPTFRERGLSCGRLPVGALNAITDVPGVQVGHCSVIKGDSVRTGVTAVLPHGGNVYREKVAGAAFVLNGFGKSLGLAQLEELGTIETPVLLTSTLSAARAADALMDVILEQNPDICITTGTVNPVVGECNDMYLNDARGRHVGSVEVRAALADAKGGPVLQGSVGGGVGMTCYGFKGGIGTSSRVVSAGTVGVLVQANFGLTEDLQICGVPVGQMLGKAGRPEPPPGSCMMIVATDIPLDARQLGRLARRAAMGLARTGTFASNGSGDFVIAFSTAQTIPHYADSRTRMVEVLHDGEMNGAFLAAVEATEEAVYNALFCSTTVRGRDGHVREEFPVEQVIAKLHSGA